MDEVIEAAKNANIHNFIMTQPDGYETNVGAKGEKLRWRLRAGRPR
jgi:ABC-type protease/lipase transport system fused ATPase/permease subunit